LMRLNARVDKWFRSVFGVEIDDWEEDWLS